MNNHDRDPRNKLLETAEDPADTDVTRVPAGPSPFAPGSVVDITWPGQMTYDADGNPSGMTAPRIYRMTAGPEGTQARWLTLQEQSA
jgi:hypothetical protein